jgi:hypothetical protein
VFQKSGEFYSFYLIVCHLQTYIFVTGDTIVKIDIEVLNVLVCVVDIEVLRTK